MLAVRDWVIFFPLPQKKLNQQNKLFYLRHQAYTPAMKKILFCVCLAGILTACASQQTVPGVEIEGLEINPRTKRTKTKTYGTELQTEELNKAFKRDQTPETQTKTEPRSPEVSGDLAKFLELEIALQRDPENEDTLAEMMDYARKYRDQVWHPAP